MTDHSLLIFTVWFGLIIIIFFFFYGSRREKMEVFEFWTRVEFLRVFKRHGQMFTRLIMSRKTRILTLNPDTIVSWFPRLHQQKNNGVLVQRVRDFSCSSFSMFECLPRDCVPWLKLDASCLSVACFPCISVHVWSLFVFVNKKRHLYTCISYLHNLWFLLILMAYCPAGNFFFFLSFLFPAIVEFTKKKKHLAI